MNNSALPLALSPLCIGVLVGWVCVGRMNLSDQSDTAGEILSFWTGGPSVLVSIMSKQRKRESDAHIYCVRDTQMHTNTSKLKWLSDGLLKERHYR